jgi:hypothetical protein
MIAPMRIALIGVGIAIAASAHAQPTPSRADQLFDEGRALMAKLDYADACPKLEESQRLDPGLGTLLNIGLCDEGLGKLATALAVWREADAQAKASGEAKRQATAEEHIAALEPRVPTVTVEVASPVPGQQIAIGGRPLDTKAWGQSQLVDPGEVAITATAPDRTPFATTITVKERDRAVVTVPELAATSLGAEPAPAHPRRTIAYGLAGGGVLATGVGVVLGLTARSSYNRAFSDGHCDRATLACDDTGQAATDSARKRGTIATVIGAVGLAAVAAGVVVYVTEPTAEHPSATGTAIAPTFSPDGAGVAITGTF